MEYPQQLIAGISAAKKSIGRFLPIHFACLLIFASALLSSSCTSRPLVAAILPTYVDPALVDGLRDAARQAGARLWVADPPETIAAEARQVTKALDLHPAALVILPLSAAESPVTLAELTKTGIPLVCLETCLQTTAASPVYNLPGPDRDAGQLAGSFVRQSLESAPGGQTTLVILECSDTPACGVRRSEFEQAVAGFPDLKIIYSRPAPTQVEVTRLFAEHPGLSLVWAAGQAETLLALAAVRELHLGAQITLVGYGMDEAVAVHLTGGDLSAASTGLPYQAGYDALSIAVRLAHSEPVPPLIRKNALIFTASSRPPGDYLTRREKFMLPTLALMPDTGSGLKPSCNCGPVPTPSTPIPDNK